MKENIQKGAYQVNETRGNHNQAPTLEFKGSKENGSQKPFYQIPQELADIIFATFARKPAALRLMLVLAGTKPGFGVSEKWVLDRTRMDHSTYIKTRKQLADDEWLLLDDKKIIVNFDKIYERSVEPTPQKNCSSESTPQKDSDLIERRESTPQIDVSQHPNSTSVNTPKGRESTPIIYNIIDNKINKDTIDNSLEITQQQLTLLADPQLIGEDEGWQYVANGNKTFKIRKEGVSVQAR